MISSEACCSEMRVLKSSLHRMIHWAYSLSVVRLQPSVVVQSWPDAVMPTTATHLLMENPFLRIVGISRNCGQIHICEQKIVSRRLPVVSLQHLIEAIHRGVRGNQGLIVTSSQLVITPEVKG